MKSALMGFVVFIAIVAGSTKGFPSSAQEQDQEEAQRQRAAAQAAQAREKQVQQAAKARQDFLDRQTLQSESNLNLAMSRAAAAKAKENEVKFDELQQVAKELLWRSQKINDQIKASGVQGMSVNFYSDLDNIDRLVKKLRKAAK